MLGRERCRHPGRAFDIEVRVGAGAYVCGEETSLLESLEGKRGIVRAKPPLPAHQGLFGKPTLVNNVLTLAAVPFILAEGADAYADFGMGRSRGTMPFQLAGNIKHGGLVELPFGVTLRRPGRRLRRRHRVRPADPRGAGRRTARRLFPARAVRHAVRLRSLRRARRPARPRRRRRVRRHGGHGGAGALRHGVLRHRKLRQVHALPHRLDARRRGHRQDRGRRRAATNLALVEDLCETMKFGSLCALGGFTPYPVMSALNHFPEDFHRTRRLRKPRSEDHMAPSMRSTTARPPPRRQARYAHDRRHRGHGARGHLDHARRHAGGNADPETLRDRPLEAFGSCRVCLVEMRGREGIPASCTTPVEPGMVYAPRRSLCAGAPRRAGALHLGSPLDCLTCAANADRELQDVAGAVGLREVRYGFEGENHSRHANQGHVGRTRAILTSRSIRRSASCVSRRPRLRRAPGHVRADGRGARVRDAGPASYRELRDTECVSCGACVQACPTATLSRSRSSPRPDPDPRVKTTCAYCGVGCSLKANSKVIRGNPNVTGSGTVARTTATHA